MRFNKPFSTRNTFECLFLKITENKQLFQLHIFSTHKPKHYLLKIQTINSFNWQARHYVPFENMLGFF